MSFSFKYGKTIAIICNDPAYNGEILCLRDENNTPNKKHQRNNVQYIQIAGKFRHVYNPLTRILYIAGPQGSGKSTYAADYIEYYLRLYPKAKFYVFSRLSEDPVIDRLNPHRVVIDQTLIEEPIDIEQEVEDGAIILFDDIDTIQDKKLQLVVNKLKADILEIGRHLNIQCVITSHLINPNERSAARTLLNEMQTLTIFPRSGSTYQMEYVLKRYFGFSPKQIKHILEMNSRWVTIFKNYPQCILSEQEAIFPRLLK
jgi:adenosyl cobinamide kinase/adenosyl cobinamide phosphate guanylyltransferase